MINIVMGLLANDTCASLKDNFEEFLLKNMGEERIGVVQCVYKRHEFDAAVLGGMYDIGIVLEKMDEVAIGQGSIKSWRESNPDMRIILVMDNGKRSTAKAKGLYDRGYFDGIFQKDFGTDEMFGLLEKGRTEEAAFYYYGLDEYRDVPKKETVSKMTGEREAKESETTVVDELRSGNDLEVEEKSPDTESGNKAINPLNLTSIVDFSDLDDMEESKLILNKKKEAEKKAKKEREKEKSENYHKAEENRNHNMEGLPEKENSNLEKKPKKMPVPKETIKEASVSPEHKHSYVPSKHEDKNVFTNSSGEEEETMDENVPRVKASIKNILEANVHVKKVSILTKMDDEEYLKNYIDFATKSNSGYSSEVASVYSECFLNTLKECSYRNVALLDDAVRGKGGRGAFEDYLEVFIEKQPAKGSEKQQAFEQILKFAYEYDILNQLIDIDSSEIHVMDYNKIRIKKGHERRNVKLSFSSLQHYKRFVRNLLIRNQDRFTAMDMNISYVDSSYSEEHLLIVNIVPAELKGSGIPEITIKKQLKNKLSIQEMIGKKLTLKEAAFLINMVQEGKGILLCGPASCGASTLLNGMLDYIPSHKNGVVISHRPEFFSKLHPEIAFYYPVLKMHTSTGKEAISDVNMELISESALHMGADYYIMGDIKGVEAYSLYKAAVAGYSVWTTVRSSSADEALDNLIDHIIDSANFLDRNTVKNVVYSKFQIVIYMNHLKVTDIRRTEKKRGGEWSLEKLDKLEA